MDGSSTPVATTTVPPATTVAEGAVAMANAPTATAPNTAIGAAFSFTDWRNCFNSWPGLIVYIMFPSTVDFPNVLDNDTPSSILGSWRDALILTFPSKIDSAIFFSRLALIVFKLYSISFIFICLKRFLSLY